MPIIPFWRLLRGGGKKKKTEGGRDGKKGEKGREKKGKEEAIKSFPRDFTVLL